MSDDSVQRSKRRALTLLRRGDPARLENGLSEPEAARIKSRILTASTEVLSTEVPPTSESSTKVPTKVLPTKVPPTSESSIDVLPTKVPTKVPPTSESSTKVPPTSESSTKVPSTKVPPTSAPWVLRSSMAAAAVLLGVGLSMWVARYDPSESPAGWPSNRSADGAHWASQVGESLASTEPEGRESPAPVAEEAAEVSQSAGLPRVDPTGADPEDGRATDPHAAASAETETAQGATSSRPARQQVQFATRRGTRVIWVLDPDFYLEPKATDL